MLSKYIKIFKDFPYHGIDFLDICPLLKDPSAFAEVIDLLIEKYKNQDFTKIVSLESRGFFFAAPLAYALKKGLIPVRKLGKLPGKTRNTAFTKEYGKDAFEIQESAIKNGDKVLILDDLLATGGSARAAGKLVAELGGEVMEFCALIELESLKGRETLPFPVHTFYKT